MTHKQIVCNWLRYGEYVATWAEIPVGERHDFDVIKVGWTWMSYRI